jgi:hypothetical protein
MRATVLGNTTALAFLGPDLFAAHTHHLLYLQCEDYTLRANVRPSVSFYSTGEALAISEDGRKALAVGPSARAIVINTAEGSAAAVFFLNGKAHALVARAEPICDPASSTSWASDIAGEGGDAAYASSSPPACLPLERYLNAVIAQTMDLKQVLDQAMAVAAGLPPPAPQACIPLRSRMEARIVGEMDLGTVE